MRKSAGILLYRKEKSKIEVLLVHPGGPFWAQKDLGVWSIPKGEYNENEDPLLAAVREVEEETGYRPQGPFLPLAPIKQKAGKQVMAWAAEGDLNPETIKSNTFKLQWPPNSGKWITIPEVDKAGWFSPAVAKQKIIPTQIPLIVELLVNLKIDN
ncbi:NUDIX domain-containing protein [Flavisolibacter tropicus]|uniref:NUDIX hydrolase n=1 Tax=Flavisolibacter tropicus TaxID=1492898 RepID=A0A172TRT5_9BACT|nr:NUDIX domain-containing protein [Flavisolibacter tropicus]ANE49795.1 NUDIX hydrolase [Flavisolibacter tropicus]